MTNSISLEDKLLIAKVRRRIVKGDDSDYLEKLLTHYQNMLTHKKFNVKVKDTLGIDADDLRVGFEKFVNSDENLNTIMAEMLLGQKDKS